MTNILHRLFATASAILISVLALSPIIPAVQASTASVQSSVVKDEGKLVQFTSAGHVLGFHDDGVTIASARHMLKVDFLDTEGVTPETGSETEVVGGKAVPLGRVTYKNLWEGVTAVYEASGSSIAKSTYYLNEGNKSDHIRLGYNRPVHIDEQGNLVVTFDHGTLTESAPIAWQEIKGQRIPVKVSYVIRGEREVGFSLGEYVSGVPVVIDPDLTWNTFLGGTGTDNVYGIVVDSSGNVYAGGFSDVSWGTPIQAHGTGSVEAFVAKFDSSGNLVWNTFMGGVGTDWGLSIAVDSSGNVYLGGSSSATWGTPVRAYTSGFDSFAAKLNSSGALVWSTFAGGSGDDYCNGIRLDSSGNVYLGGNSSATWGSPVRAYVLGTDAYAVKFDGSGNLVWNTFVGGTGSDSGLSVAVASTGDVYVSGNSTVDWGTPIRAYTLGTDAFVAKIDGSGNLVWNTFLGGTGTDQGIAIAVDATGNAYLGGFGPTTWGTPVRPYTASNDAFVVKFDSSGTILWSTFLGGTASDSSRGIIIDNSGNTHIGGNTAATWGAPVRAYTAGTDSFAAKLDSSGNLLWHTFLGGAGGDQVRAMGADSSGNMYVGGYSDATWSTPVRGYTLAQDGYVAKISDITPSFGGGSSHPIIRLTKEATPASLPDGKASVTYTYVMTNPGNVTLTDITLVDDKCSNVIYISGDANGNSLLETNETWTYTCTVVLTKTTINFATAQGFGAGLVTSDTAIAEVFVGTPPPPTTTPTATSTSTEPAPPIVAYRDLRHALVKLPDDGNINTQHDSALYYIGSDGKRHAFPNEKVYFTWYTNFNGVQVMDESQLASIPLGKNVTYKPGVKMVKFASDPKVYAVSRNGVLRWITSESIAISLYGIDWTLRIDDISDAFYTNYQFGAEIDSTSDYDPAAEEASVTYPGESL